MQVLLSPLPDMGWFYVASVIGLGALLLLAPVTISLEGSIIYLTLSRGRKAGAGEFSSTRAWIDALIMNLVSGILGYFSMYNYPFGTLRWAGIRDMYFAAPGDPLRLTILTMTTLLAVSLVVEWLVLLVREYRRASLGKITLAVVTANLVTYILMTLIQIVATGGMTTY